MSTSYCPHCKRVVIARDDETCPACGGITQDSVPAIPAAAEQNLTKLPPSPSADLKAAVYVIAVYAALVSFLPVFLFSTEDLTQADAFQRTVLVILTLLAVILWLSVVLLARKRSLGATLWWIASPLVVIQCPLGTAVALYVSSKLRKPSAKAELK